MLITRAQPQADASAHAVRQLGWEPLVLPLTQTETISAGLQAVRALEHDRNRLMVATSARAIEALEAGGLGGWAAGQSWAVVGSRAGDALKSLGAQLAIEPAEDVESLIDALGGEAGPLTYLAGADRKLALEATFPAMQTIEIYKARALGGFSPQAIAALVAEPAAFTMVYSSRGALLLGQALQARDLTGRLLQETLSDMVWLCLSDDVAKAAPEGARIAVAKTPHQEALLALLPTASTA